jgi:hypothetical protein
MRRAALVTALALTTGSCEFAQKHPAVTAGLTAGGMAFFGCEADGVDFTPCAKVTGVVGLGLFAVTFLATTFLTTSEDTEPVAVEGDQEMTQGGAIKVHTHTAPPPVMIDAGVDAAVDAPVAQVAPVADAPAD